MPAVLYEDFTDPYVDVDEWRDAPVRHRYVHGGFASNSTRFSLYLPPAEQYQGRFFQHFTPVPDSEFLAVSATGQEDRIGFAVSSGAYFLETNGGADVHVPGSQGDPTLSAYRANAACAEYSRSVAQGMYGTHRPYGYAYGGSGGAFRTIGAAENTTGVWDGFVPYVPGSPMAIPNVFSVRMHAMRVLRNAFDGIVDALEPGGSGDPLVGLTSEEREAFLEVTRMGFPPRSWTAHRTMGIHAFAVLYQALVTMDPTYFEEFWTAPGYLGTDPASSVRRDRLQVDARVTGVIGLREAAARALPLSPQAGRARGGVDNAFAASANDDAVAALQLDITLPDDLQSAVLRVTSGAAAGASFNLRAARVRVIVFDEQAIGTLVQGIAVGDGVRIDNSNFLAAQTYHRHQVPGTEYAVWDQFRNQDGTPRYPQRPMIVGPMMAMGATGTLQTGHIHDRMIVVACLLDREAFPWQADWYRQRVTEHLGARAEDMFRLWFVDHALHGDFERQDDPTHSVSYVGVLHEALRALSAWVERGVEPAASTAYRVVEGQVEVPAAALERLGVQPTIRLLANGATRAEVMAGEDVVFTVTAEAPPAGAPIVRLEWDFEGQGEFAAADDLAGERQVRLSRTHAFNDVGTHFVTVRVRAQHERDSGTPFARVDNLGRVRVVVV